MEHFNTSMIRLYLAFATPLQGPHPGPHSRWPAGRDRVRDERGDVPGWVMITVMTVALVGVIWGVADTQLSKLLKDALAGLTKG